MLPSSSFEFLLLTLLLGEETRDPTQSVGSEGFGGGSDLVEVPGDGDLQGEVAARGYRCVELPLLGAPASMLHGVGDHIRGTIVTGVKMEGDVCPLPRTALQIHTEPET